MSTSLGLLSVVGQIFFGREAKARARTEEVRRMEGDFMGSGMVWSRRELERSGDIRDLSRA